VNPDPLRPLLVETNASTIYLNHLKYL